MDNDTMKKVKGFSNNLAAAVAEFEKLHGIVIKDIGFERNYAQLKDDPETAQLTSVTPTFSISIK